MESESFEDEDLVASIVAHTGLSPEFLNARTNKEFFAAVENEGWNLEQFAESAATWKLSRDAEEAEKKKQLDRSNKVLSLLENPPNPFVVPDPFEAYLEKLRSSILENLDEHSIWSFVELNRTGFCGGTNI